MRRHVGRERRDRSTGRACMLGEMWGGVMGITAHTLLARQDLLAPRVEEPPRLPHIEHKGARAPVGQVVPRRRHAGGGSVPAHQFHSAHDEHPIAFIRGLAGGKRAPLPNKGPLALKVRLAARAPRVAPPQQRAKGGRREWALHLRDKKRKRSRASAASMLKGGYAYTNTQQNAVQVQLMWYDGTQLDNMHVYLYVCVWRLCARGCRSPGRGPVSRPPPRRGGAS